MFFHGFFSCSDIFLIRMGSIYRKNTYARCRGSKRKPRRCLSMVFRVNCNNYTDINSFHQRILLSLGEWFCWLKLHKIRGRSCTEGLGIVNVWSCPANNPWTLALRTADLPCLPPRDGPQRGEVKMGNINEVLGVSVPVCLSVIRRKTCSSRDVPFVYN